MGKEEVEIIWWVEKEKKIKLKKKKKKRRTKIDKSINSTGRASIDKTRGQKTRKDSDGEKIIKMTVTGARRPKEAVISRTKRVALLLLSTFLSSF